MRQNLKKKSLFAVLFLIAGAAGGQNMAAPGAAYQGELIRQVAALDNDNVLGFQKLNQSGFENGAMVLQVGEENKTVLNQHHGISGEPSNLLSCFQTGAFNEMTIGQIGTGNMVVGFQLGYVANSASFSDHLEQILSLCKTVDADDWNSGERNRQHVCQEGTSNFMIAVQAGNDNVIQAVQKGSGNSLFIMQNGSFNIVTGYEQSNQSDGWLTDTILQEGQGLIISASGSSRSRMNGSDLTQRGINLWMEIDNDFINTTGGVDVIQTGRDMKVVIDQSYFL